MNMSFISYLINGLSLGSVYAIIALGYTMVYGIAKMLNFAHGDVIMVGAYAALLAMTQGGMSPVVAVLIAVCVCTLLGIVIERIAYKPLRNASSSLAVLITAIGVSYLLQNLALLFFGPSAQTFPSVIKWKGLSFANWDTDDLRRNDRDDHRLPDHRGGPGYICAEDEAGTGYARGFQKIKARHS